jgi:uncharacterized cupin superfamily protein
MPEARIEETAAGLVPADDGWFVLNVGEIAWDAQPGGWAGHPGGGTWCTFEAPSAPSDALGIGVHVLMPGETSGLYHAESDQEGFLVLSGEALLLVEGQERPLRPWDYFHCPPGVAHITVGAGDGPCAILMVGTRSPDHSIVYPADPVAARHGASVAAETTDARQAYAGRPEHVPARSPWAEIVGEGGTVGDGTAEVGRAEDGTVGDGTAEGGTVGDGTGERGTVADGPSVAELQRQVRILSAALGIAVPERPLLDDVAALAREGKRVQAIRDLRRGAEGKLGLVAAKRIVDALADGA